MRTKRATRRPSQPTEPQAENYVLREYGVTAQELDRFVKKTSRQIARERKAGTIKQYTGDLEADIAD